MNPHRRTFSAKPQESQDQRGWWVVDATDQPLGRLATLVADKLRGKDKPIFTPHVDTGDFVIVVNASKVKLTGRKLEQKQYYHHTGHPGGIKAHGYDYLIANQPELPVRKAVWGMIPKGPLGRKIIKKLKVYGGPSHDHAAQQPKVLEVK
ncbi:MAG: 50S ribosomal protein L13 [Deltaproteobacteria bacterium]|nr:50S ribosomal protein L13 [Deltaproteobacteria bacterium]